MNRVIVGIIILLILLAVIYYFKYSRECFESDDNVSVLIFVSETCPHCQTYKSEQHDKVLNFFSDKKNVDVKLVESGKDQGSSELFSKFDVKFVPACVIIKGDKSDKLQKMITLENIQEKISSM